MENPASVDDLAVRWHPNPLADSAAAENAETVLDDAWEALQAESPGIEDRLAAGTAREALVVRAVVYAALRVLQNPENYTDGSVSIDDFANTWKRDPSTVSSDLWFPATELRRLGVRSAGAFSIRPGAA